MKTIRTATGTKTIDDWNASIVPLQLQDILRDLRFKVILRLISGLGVYIDYKFAHKATERQIEKIKASLYTLGNAALNIDNYRDLLERVLKNEHSYIDTSLFYAEIDSIIRPELKSTTSPFLVYKATTEDLLHNFRKDLIDELLTDKGLKEFVWQKYEQSIEDEFKKLYIMDELRNYFAKEPTDYNGLLLVIKENRLDMKDANQEYFDNEMKKVLDKHFIGVYSGETISHTSLPVENSHHQLYISAEQKDTLPF